MSNVMSRPRQRRLQAVLAAYGADPRRWPEADRRELEHFLEPAAAEATAARQIDAVLGLARSPEGEQAALAGILRQVGRTAPEAGNIVLLRPRANRERSMIGWLAAVPLAASLVMGIYAGTAGALNSFLPSALVGDTVAAGDDPGDLSGVSDIEAMTEEDVS